MNLMVIVIKDSRSDKLSAFLKDIPAITVQGKDLNDIKIRLRKAIDNFVDYLSKSKNNFDYKEVSFELSK